MPQLSNRQFEEFCHAIISGQSQTEAAKSVGYSEGIAHNTGSRLMKRPDVRQRVEELRQSIDNNPNDLATKSYIVSQTIRIHRKCFQEKQYSVSVACMQLLARLQGYLVEKRESTSLKLSMVNMTPAELNRALREHVSGIPEQAQAGLLTAPEVAQALDVTAQECAPETCEIEQSFSADTTTRSETPFANAE